MGDQSRTKSSRYKGREKNQCGGAAIRASTNTEARRTSKRPGKKGRLAPPLLFLTVYLVEGENLETNLLRPAPAPRLCCNANALAGATKGPLLERCLRYRPTRPYGAPTGREIHLGEGFPSLEETPPPAPVPRPFPGWTLAAGEGMIMLSDVGARLGTALSTAASCRS